MRKISKSGNSCFTRWSRKGYAVFASLGKVVKIGVLSATMSLVIFTPKHLYGQADTLAAARTIAIEALNVTAEKLNPTRGVVTPTAVWGRDSIGAMPMQTIESVLRLNPAIDLRERGAKGMQADISLRGGTYDQTMVLLNGIDFSDARTGHQSHSLPVDIELVNSVDIIGGLTGIGAYAGAINITTTPLRPRYLRAELTGGQYGYLYNNISGAYTRDDLSVMAAVSNRRSDGYTSNTDFRNTNLFTRINYNSPRAGLFDFQAGYQRRDMGENGFYSLAYPNQFEHTATALTSLRWSLDTGPFCLNANVRYRKNDDRYELYRGGIGASENWRPNYHTTDVAGAEIGADYYWIAGKTTLGADYTFQHIYSNVLGEEIADPVRIPNTDLFYTHEKSRNIYNIWLSHSVNLRSTSLAGSVSAANSPYGTFPSWSVSISQRLHENWHLNANSTRSMRLPTFTDLYYTNPTHRSNPDLMPEKALTNQLGLRFAKGKFHAGALAYYRMGEDIIDWVQLSGETVWQSMQLTELNTFGSEVTLSYNHGRFLRGVTVSYGYIHTDKKSGDYVSKYALDYMKHKISLMAGFDLTHGFSLDITAAWYNRNGKYKLTGDAEIEYVPYLLVDTRLSWHNRMLTVYLDATNLTNEKYFDFGGLVQPSRWINAGIVITI